VFSLHIDTARTWRGGQGQVMHTVMGLRARKERAALVAHPEGELYRRMSEGTGDGMAELAGFYDREIKPYLAGSPKDPATLVEDETASLLFDLQRESTPLALQETLDQWERICADARRLYAQRRVHRLLHGWLIVHVPLSAALVVLVIVHAVMAIRFI